MSEKGPGDGLDPARMPGHWLLARLGKRVLRPGGRELTEWMLERLDIGADDSVLDIAPGLGATAELALARGPRDYLAVERDPVAAAALAGRLAGPGRRVANGSAEAIDLPDGAASVAYAEAVLTMSPPAARRRIIAEAARALGPGGRLGLHELALVPDGLDRPTREEIGRDLSATLRVGARPLTPAEWRALVHEAGLEVTAEAGAPMALLTPGRLACDEGVLGALRFAANALRDPVARRRVLAIRSAFRRHAGNLAAIALVARRPAEIAS